MRPAPEVVWRHVIEFPELPKADGIGCLCLGAGVSETGGDHWVLGLGAGAALHIFGRGFVEPINRPRGRRIGCYCFTVTQNPPSMEERSIYTDLQTPHLNGYLESKHGVNLV